MLNLFLFVLFFPLIVLVVMFIWLMVFRVAIVPFEIAHAYKESKITNKQFMTIFYVIVALLVLLSQII